MKTSCVESVNTCSSSILRSLQSCNSDDGSESGGAAVLWLLMLLDVPGNLTATYAPSTLSTYGINKSNKLLNWDAVKEKQESKKKIIKVWPSLYSNICFRCTYLSHRNIFNIFHKDYLSKRPLLLIDLFFLFGSWCGASSLYKRDSTFNFSRFIIVYHLH